jgi:hypothetical protein
VPPQDVDRFGRRPTTIVALFGAAIGVHRHHAAAEVDSAPPQRPQLAA